MPIIGRLPGYGISIILITLLLASGIASADPSLSEALGKKAGTTAMDLLKFEKGNENILALTNAGHAFIDGKTTERAMEGLTEATGLSNGKSSLFQLNRPNSEPIWFYFYNKDTGMALYLEPDPTIYSKNPDDITDTDADRVFSLISVADVNLDHMLKNTDSGNSTFTEKVFNGKEFALVGISNIWAEPEATYDFLNAACFHDHLCPGVTSGYMITRYVEEILPINSSSQKYISISCPNWCKEDAIQMIWDATPGKSSMFVMALSEDDTKIMEEKYKTGPAGIIIRWDSATNSGDAVALGFDWDTMNELTGATSWTGPTWGSKLAMDVEMMQYWDHPEDAVSTLKEFTVDEKMLGQLKTAGNNPYQVAGLL